MEISEKQKIYRDFLTNSAVAWFTVGVITPLVIGYTHISNFAFTVLSAIISYIFIKLAEKAIET